MPLWLGEFTTRMEYCHPVSRRDLRELASEELPSFRSIRYGGDNLSLKLETFSPEDQTLILHLYNILAELYRDLKAHRNAPGLATAIASGFARKVDLEKLTESIHSLGKSMSIRKGDRLFHQVLHDIRGGALTTLLMRLDLIASGISSSNDADQIFFLVRDHLKIMRNAISDVDAEWRIEDEGRKLHHLSLLTEKWERAIHYRQKQPVKITFTLDYEGNVAERCLEFSALDRVSYNMINNAVRFAEDFRVEFTVLGIPESGAKNLRFAVINQISGEHLTMLNQRVQNRFDRLFLGGFTTGGSGHGLRICTDFVTNAYGLSSAEACVQGGYVGAKIIKHYFVSWFHWPIADEC